MLILNQHLDPPIFTMSEPAKQALESPPEYFRPELTNCPQCQTLLNIYKRTAERTVVTLNGVRRMSEILTYCSNLDCPGRLWDANTETWMPLVFTSEAMKELVLPRMKYGLDVICEVGRQFKLNPRPGKIIQTEIAKQYELYIPLATLYRQKD